MAVTLWCCILGVILGVGLAVALAWCWERVCGRLRRVEARIERIEQLARQAGIVHWDDGAWRGGDGPYEG